jgi:8-oxo-dGTP diphosphatase
MKTINVVAAILIHENKVFATQRNYGEFKGGWEFPGGKIEPDEAPQAALRREMKEELALEISVGELIDTIEYDYPNFHLSMQCYLCKIQAGKAILSVHDEIKWLDKENLYSVDWLPADVGLLPKIKNYLD